MRVSVDYSAQIKRVASCEREELEIGDGSTALDLIRHLVDVHGDPLRGCLLGEGGRLRPTILAFVNDEQLAWDVDLGLKEGDEVVFMSAIAGGVGNRDCHSERA